MTTRTMPALHEERCRQLAEKLDSTHPEDLSFAQAVWPDKRFASLRGKHYVVHETEDIYESLGVCLHCRVQSPDDDDFCLRTDGDALDEAIAACGLFITRLAKDAAVGQDHAWGVVLNAWRASEWRVAGYAAEGPTSREARSAALWTYVFGS